MTVGAGTVRALPGTRGVDAGTVADLLSGVSDLAAAVTAPRLGRSERLSRAARAAAGARDVSAFVRGLDPYADGRHCRVRDMLHLAGDRHWAEGNGTADEAAERVAMAGQRDAMRHQLRATVWADFTGMQKPSGVAAVSPAPPSGAQWLAGYTRPAELADVGPASLVPGAWESIPDGALGNHTEIPDGTPAELPGSQLAWQSAQYGVNESRQLVDWTTSAAVEVEQLIGLVVDRTLEKFLLGQLTTDAATAASFEAAEVAVGAAWPTGADLVLCSGADAPKVRRSYAGEDLHGDEHPLILPTAGATTGTAVVLASGGVHAEVTPLSWLLTERPSELGRDVVAYRYGRARLRVSGAVQLVTVA